MGFAFDDDDEEDDDDDFVESLIRLPLSSSYAPTPTCSTSKEKSNIKNDADTSIGRNENDSRHSEGFHNSTIPIPDPVPSIYDNSANKTIDLADDSQSDLDLLRPKRKSAEDENHDGNLEDESAPPPYKKRITNTGRNRNRILSDSDESDINTLEEEGTTDLLSDLIILPLIQ